MNFALTPLQLRRIPNDIARCSATPTDNLPFISDGSSLNAFCNVESAIPVISYWANKGIKRDLPELNQRK
ncbi:hypothetical protein ABE485_04955 [Achromobacter spanius]|uniref:hypothetical protein n=1 Tax=Achromobacter spanius TaxID=217203 RepID=UPI00320ACE95